MSLGYDTYKIIKISDKEYHIQEFQFGRMTDNPYVIAKCSGPVPANDVMTALVLRQNLRYKSQQLKDAQELIKQDIVKGLETLEQTIKSYHHVEVT